MRLRNFTGRSLREVMDEVRRHFGAEAVILHTHQPRRGEVCVTAAVEAADEAESRARPGEGFPAAAVDGMAEALEALVETLAYHRIPPALADRLMAEAIMAASDKAKQALAAALDALLDFVALDAAHAPLLLIGPPGAGKTVAAAKICAQSTIEGHRPHLFTMDATKSGAEAQAKAFARALGCGATKVASPGALARAVAERGPGIAAVVDTFGVNPFRADELARLDEAREAVGATPIVVMPPGGDAMETEDMARAFAEIGVRALLASKIDQARRWGGLLAAASDSGLAFTGAGTSPHLGATLLPLVPLELAGLLVRGYLENAADPFLQR
jgi:flagellar biosynthesis protein FlhF